MTHIKEETG